MSNKQLTLWLFGPSTGTISSGEVCVVQLQLLPASCSQPEQQHTVQQATCSCWQVHRISLAKLFRAVCRAQGCTLGERMHTSHNPGLTQPALVCTLLRFV